MPKDPDASAGRRVDLKEVKQLIKLMLDNDLRELEIADGPMRLHLKRGAESAAAAPGAPGAAVPGGPGGPVAAGSAPSAGPTEHLVEIRSPMVGTFYAAPSPDNDPYVHVGSVLGEESVVCIVEAMKVMNEIKADCAGVVREVCARNAQPVEYGQVLFRVKPD